MVNLIPRKNLNITTKVAVGGAYPDNVIGEIKLTPSTMKSYLIKTSDDSYSFTPFNN